MQYECNISNLAKNQHKYFATLTCFSTLWTQWFKMSKQWLHDIWWKFIRFELFLAWFVTGWNISTVFTLLIKPLHIAFHLQKNTRVDQGSSITLENFNEHLAGKVDLKRHITVIENCNYLHIMLAFTIVCIIQVI